MDAAFASEAFDWDRNNVQKIWQKHRGKFSEAEEVFFDERVKIMPDSPHSETELRQLALGQTRTGRNLFVVFTERRGKIRVISARDMHRKERAIYEQAD